MSSSSQMSTSTAPAFPQVDDTFPSLVAFKLACHRAALANGIELKIKTGDANRADMRCRLGERATVNKVQDGPCCSFQIAVYKSVVDANAGDFRVNKRNLVHSCPLEVRQQRKSSGDTAQWSRGKIKELEDALHMEEAPVRSPVAKKRRRGNGSRSEADKEKAATLPPRDNSAGFVGSVPSTGSPQRPAEPLEVRLFFSSYLWRPLTSLARRSRRSSFLLTAALVASHAPQPVPPSTRQHKVTALPLHLDPTSTSSPTLKRSLRFSCPT
ncbi:hypothetical protein AAT19DRAFT_15648 [Rhodotorula toruloides]|uniref:Uncharacterized protein n=1 Tax=Rhodotorula toruloides TaxID=5286 RepID=A0A2T0A7S8_RHOTO|nr:hypothetical protein AAT19DRAFT_15648 [Rhodotorula toruloides]